MAKLSFRVQADYDKVQRLREEIEKLKQELKSTDAMQTPHAFNVLNNKLFQTSQELGKVEAKIITTSVTLENDFRKKIYSASQGVNDFTEKIIAQKAVVRETQDNVRRLADAYREAKKAKDGNADGLFSQWKNAKAGLESQRAALFGLTQEQATARLSVKKLRDEYALFKEDGGGTADTLELLTSKMKGITATVMGGMGLKELASRIISVRAEFESMETSLKVLLGGSQEKLNSIMGQIKEYALASPLNTKDMVGAVQMMTSFGIEAEKSIDYLKAIGDISMGDTGKFNSLALAFSQMSSAGKLMGQDLMQMVNAGFNPLEEISRKTGKSIGQLKEEMSKGAISAQMVQDAFISATSAGGKFYGMSQEGAKTLNGQISMLQESFDNMFNEIGSKGEGVVMTAVQTATKLVENYEHTGRVLLGLVTVYGTYRTALAIATFSQNGHTFAMTLARTQILLTQKAEAALNKTILANPYAMAVMALGALVGGLMMQKTQTDLVNDATKRYNEQLEKAIEQEKKHNEEIQKLCDIAGDESLSTDNRRLALVKLEQKYPDIFKKYDTEAEKLAHIRDINAQIVQFESMRSFANPKNELSKINKRLAELDKNKHRTMQTVSGMPLIMGGGMQMQYGLTREEEAEQTSLLKRKNELTKQINKDVSDNYLANLTGVSNAYLDKQIKQRENLIAKMSLTEKKYGKTTVGGAKGVYTKDELDGQLQILKAEREKRTKKPVTTKKDLQEQKKALQTELDGLSEIEAKGKKGTELKKKIAALTKREDEAYSTSSGGKNVTKVDAVKLQNNIEAQKTALSLAQVELENEVEQSRIDAMKEGHKKTLAAMALAHKKELEQIEKQKLDYLKKKQEEAKAIFEANPKNKDKTFDVSSVALSADENAKFDEMRKNVKIKHENEDLEAHNAQIQIMRDYIKEYGSIQEQKLAITQEYNQKIAESDNAFQQARLTAERDKAIAELDLKAMQDSINWEHVFSDISTYSTQYLIAIKDKLRSALNAKDITAENAKILTEKIREIENTIIDRTDIFSALLPGLRERKRLTEETARAQENLNKAVAESIGADSEVFSRQQEILDKLKGAGIDASLNDITEKNKENLLSSVDRGSELYKALLKLFENLATDNIKAEKKKESASSAKSKYDALWDKLKKMNSITDLFGSVKGNPLAIADLANKNIQSANDLIGTLGLKDTDFGHAFGKFAEGAGNFSNAISSLTSGDVFGAVNGVIKGFVSLGGIFGTRSNHEEQMAIQAEISKRIEILNGSINKLTDKIDKAYGADAIKFGNDALNLQNKNVKEAWQGVFSAGSDNYGKGHSDFYHWNKNTRAMAKSIAQNYGIDNVNSWQDLFTALQNMKDNKGAEILNDIRTNHGNDWWLTMQTQGYNDGAIGKWLNQIADSVDKISDINDRVKAQITGTTADNVFGSFMENLYSLADSAEDIFNDISDNWQKMVNKMVLNNIIGKKYQKELTDWYEQWYEAYNNDKDIDETEIAKLKEQYDDIVRRGIAEVEKAKIDGLISGTSSHSQNATANGISSISYDQANNLTGLGTSIQIAGEQRNVKLDTANERLSLVNLTLSDLKEYQKQHKEIANETRDILKDSYMELKEINEHTGNSASHLKEIKGEIKELKKIIKDSI